jgi:hypothetical protein
MTFASPASSASDSIKVADLANHLLIITPIEYKIGIQTVHGIAEAVEVNVYDLDTNTEHNSLLWFNVALRNALKTKINEKILARIGQGTAKPGKSAPWILLDATSDPQALMKANNYLLTAKPAPCACACACRIPDKSNGRAIS